MIRRGYALWQAWLDVGSGAGCASRTGGSAQSIRRKVEVCELQDGELERGRLLSGSEGEEA